jgi:hypothetical protein
MFFFLNIPGDGIGCFKIWYIYIYRLFQINEIEKQQQRTSSYAATP